MEDQESLEPSALVSQLTDAVQNKIHDLLADGVVASGVVVCGIFLASQHLLGVEQLPRETSINIYFKIICRHTGIVFGMLNFKVRLFMGNADFDLRDEKIRDANFCPT